MPKDTADANDKTSVMGNNQPQCQMRWGPGLCSAGSAESGGVGVAVVLVALGLIAADAAVVDSVASCCGARKPSATANVGVA